MERIATISAINIVMPRPHDPDRYAAMFRDIYRKRVTARIRGDYVGLLGSLQTGKSGRLAMLSGDIYKFMLLDQTKGWFNLESSAPAGDEELAKISIPENLKPHFQIVSFVFFPATHRFFFLSKNGDASIGPRVARGFLQRLFDSQFIVESYGDIEVTVEPEVEALTRIFAIKHLRELRMEIMPPNADDNDWAEQKIMSRLQDQNARKLAITLTAERGGDLDPDKATRDLAKIAKSNGFVAGKGRDANGIAVELSTVNHPLQERVPFNTNVQTAQDVLSMTATQLNEQPPNSA